MSECKECGRLLNEGEINLCPACKSDRSHRRRRWTEVIGGAIVVVGGIAIKVLTGGKGGGEA